MKFRNLFLLVIVLALPMLLAACGGNKVDNAEKFLKALSDNDIDEAKKYVCDKEKDNTGDSDNAFEGVTISDISCKEDGDNVTCDYKMAIEGVEDAIETSVTFKMDGDKVCGSTGE